MIHVLEACGIVLLILLATFAPCFLLLWCAFGTDWRRKK